MTLEQRRALIDPGYKELSIVRQCEVLGIHRSGFYFTPKPVCEEDLRIMRLMDELHLEDPCRGTRRLVDELLEKGVRIGRDKARRLMQAMRIKAVYCVPRTTVIDKTKYKFPYLLRDLKITRKNQVWAVDITYLPIRGGFMYMVAVIDLYSRYILNWSISNSMEAEWVVGMLKEAISLHQQRPRVPVHQRGLHGHVPQGWCGRRREDQHGRQGPGDRQRLHRALLAHPEA